MLTVTKLINLLEEERKRKGYKVTEFAALFGHTETWWHNIKRGKHDIRIEDLLRVMHVLDFDFAIVKGHHKPYLELTPEESASVLRLLVSYGRARMGSIPPVLRGAIYKMIHKV